MQYKPSSGHDQGRVCFAAVYSASVRIAESPNRFALLLSTLLRFILSGYLVDQPSPVHPVPTSSSAMVLCFRLHGTKSNT